MALEIVLAVVAALAVLVAVVSVLRGKSSGAAPEVEALRNDVNILRETNSKSIQLIAEQVRAIASNVQTSLEAVRSDVGNRLDANASAMSQTSKTVNDRMANVQTAFASLQKQVGEMSEQARQIAEVSKGLGDLERIFSAPKLRGGVGEMQLENLLSQVFAREQYEVQYRFSSGDIADALVHLPQGGVVIDSKFSLENFRRMASAASDAERKAMRREFIKDVRRRIDEIAGKYIRPAEGTLPLALMYVPAENVYYEAIIRDENGDDLYDYCVQRRVFPVSPNSLYAYLQTIIVGMNGMRVSQRAESILREIQSLKLEVEEFDAVFGKLGTHLKNAVNNYELSVRELGKLENRLQSLSGTDAQKSLFEEKKRALSAGE
ncbi:MAG: DNA recombination protein RmuC [Candidatus Koribacter versatilis]|uniref:DNA recombination protein RmuC n=1 Tax=Candidatus Korobacter versatilis TaxID=658062 RepID=A0A932A858_9BACT|nr:DNA recombination protein RmuC [Candidatus Koribacter versatilis]